MECPFSNLMVEIREGFWDFFDLEFLQTSGECINPSSGESQILSQG